MPDCRATFAVVFFLLVVLACQAPRPAMDQGSAPRGSRAAEASSAPARDLGRDEAVGGHTLRRHVGRSDEQLRERLAREPNISAASTWTDRETAEQAVGVALQANQSRIERWLARSGGHPNLVLDFDGDAARPIGRTLRRGASQSEPCSHAVVVLKWASGTGYYVLTSYPECR